MKKGLGFYFVVVGVVVGAVPGWSGDGVVALQTAAPSCPDDSGDIYVDCGNGTVTDNRTGLVWLKNANCLSSASGGGVVSWSVATDFVAGLSDKPASSVAAAEDCGLSDNSAAGEWRLPSAEEWEAMIVDAVALGCTLFGSEGPPSITNDSGTDCWAEGAGSSFTGVVSSFYWSFSTKVDDPAIAWGAGLDGCEVAGIVVKVGGGYVWPVRGGQ